MLTAQPYLQLLPSILVLLRPFTVIFPKHCKPIDPFPLESKVSLHYLARFDDTLDFIDHERANTHWEESVVAGHVAGIQHTLFADQGVVAVIRIVRISC